MQAWDYVEQDGIYCALTRSDITTFRARKARQTNERRCTILVKFIEATNGPRNWGKFCVGRFDTEWGQRSIVVESFSLLRATGWTPKHLLVIDLQTGEGAIFRPGGLADADLNRHKIWCCPLFPHFLAWLYKQDLTDLARLPDHVDLPDAPFHLTGTRGGRPL